MPYLPFTIAMLLAAPAGATHAAMPDGPGAPCPAIPAAPPPELSGWSKAEPLPAGRTTAARAPLAVGQAARLTLSPTPAIAYRVPPAKPGEPASFGGMAGFAIVRAGTYRVALSSAAWIDVVRAGSPVPSIAHRHGPACTGIRKLVDFALAPGSYLLQIAASDAPEITVIVVGPR